MNYKYAMGASSSGLPPFSLPSHLVPLAQRSIFTLTITKSKDQAANFTFVVDFDHYDNSEILRAVLPRTKQDYRRALYIFDKLVPLVNALTSGGHFSRSLITSVRFLSLHPKAVNPPDIQTFKAFIEFAARGI